MVIFYLQKLVFFYMVCGSCMVQLFMDGLAPAGFGLVGRKWQTPRAAVNLGGFGSNPVSPGRKYLMASARKPRAMIIIRAKCVAIMLRTIISRAGIKISG